MREVEKRGVVEERGEEGKRGGGKRGRLRKEEWERRGERRGREEGGKGGEDWREGSLSPPTDTENLERHSYTSVVSLTLHPYLLQ